MAYAALDAWVAVEVHSAILAKGGGGKGGGGKASGTGGASGGGKPKQPQPPQQHGVCHDVLTGEGTDPVSVSVLTGEGLVGEQDCGSGVLEVRDAREREREREERAVRESR